MSAAQETTEGTYRLKIEDVILIAVFNEQQLTAQVAVGRDGNITAPFVGIIRAVGKTTSELEAELAEEFKRRLRLRDPKVSVIIQQFRPIRVTITGAVVNPGSEAFRPTDTVLTAIAAAGGVAGTGDQRRVTLRRAGSRELIPIDLQAMIQYGDMSQNFTVQDGDEIIVPEDTRNRVLVLGPVVQPGFYPWRETLTAADALSLARGEIINRTKLSKTAILRLRPGDDQNYFRIEVDLARFFNRGDSSQNVRLMPGDVVVFSTTDAPDWDRIGSIANSLFVLDRFTREGLFGFRLFGR